MPSTSNNEDDDDDEEAEEAVLPEMVVGFLNEFLLNCVILDMTGLYQNIAAPCA